MRRRAGIVLALLLVLTGCTPAEPAGPAAEPAAEPVYMALTFDDGPSPSNTPRLLEGLSRRGVRATFFLVGSRIEGREDLVRRIRQEGHQIGNHSFGHGDLTDLSAAQALADLDKCSRALEQVLGPGSYWLRPPYGFISQEELCALGTPAICWSVDTEDWKSRNVDSILDIVLRQATTAIPPASRRPWRSWTGCSPGGCSSSPWRNCSPSRGCSLPAGPCTAVCGANKTRILSKMTMDAGARGAYNRARFQKEQTP